MKPFDIELAKANRPVQTRDGRPVRIICYDRQSHCNSHPIVALVPVKGQEATVYYTENGVYSEGQESAFDLFMTSKTVEGWVNLYKSISGGLTVGGYLYDSEQKAINAGWEEDYFTTGKLIYEE